MASDEQIKRLEYLKAERKQAGIDFVNAETRMIHLDREMRELRRAMLTASPLGEQSHG